MENKTDTKKKAAESAPGEGKPGCEETSSQTAQPVPETVTISRADYEALNDRVKELEGMKEKLVRSAADFENAKKRLSRERDEFVKFGQESLLRNILPVLDNFERALSHAELPAEASKTAAGKQFANVITGIEMTYKQLVDILKTQGLTRIKALGELYDPHKHETLNYVEGEGREDEIIAEIEPGYMLHDRLLRAAKVSVRTAPKSSGNSAPSGEDKHA